MTGGRRFIATPCNVSGRHDARFEKCHEALHESPANLLGACNGFKREINDRQGELTELRGLWSQAQLRPPHAWPNGPWVSPIYRFLDFANQFRHAPDVLLSVGLWLPEKTRQTAIMRSSMWGSIVMS